MDHSELDAKIRVLLERGEIERATERVLRAYGAELTRYLYAVLPSEADAHEAFSHMSEELWKSLSRFDGRCSVRTWCYMLARAAASYVRRHPRNDREFLVSRIPSIQHAMADVWSSSMARSAQHRKVYSDIRNTLDDDDQTLLELRVDRGLSWHEIAMVVLGVGVMEDELAKKAAALRKQFERVKDRLAALAAERLSE